VPIPTIFFFPITSESTILPNSSPNDQKPGPALSYVNNPAE